MTRKLLPLLLLLLSFSLPAYAADGSASPYELSISESSYGLGLLGGYGVEIGEPPELDFAFLHPYVTFPLTGPVGDAFYRGVLEYKLEVDLALIDNFEQRGEFGFSPVGLRYSFTAAGSRFVPYVEGMLGATYINIPRSIQGTKFNFIESAAIGARYFVTGKTSLEVQVRYRHLSNAGIRNPNPGINTGIIMVGLNYY